ncbi:MAG: preprotein translocase subunit SecA [Thermoleophilia bacterium]|nr:preprotein translocase subunit SecA [Thermoleophilia bacterium]
MADTRPWWERALAFSERRRVKELVKRAARITELEPEFQRLSAAQIVEKTHELQRRVQEGGESLDDVLPEAFANCREASVRVMGMRHFDMQFVGGIALHEGSVAEMLTGEGKTLVATLPLYLNALSGNNVHLVTTNDYLAKRDAEWMRPLYEALGLTVGFLQNQQPTDEKHAAYACDITYGTNSEFGFDYLRDNMAYSVEEVFQRGHFFAIVDEADSILIDEARTPLIISGQPEEAAETYFQFAKIAEKMRDGEHFEFDEKMHVAYPTEAGVTLAEKQLGIENLYLPEHSQLVNHLNQAIRARTLYARDKEYVIKPDEKTGEPSVKIVDENTGRVMVGRRWSEGLHQAIEAKEGVRPQQENVTVASITIQNYFRLYDKLAGMTGTAQTEAAELKEIYNLDVVQVPPNRPVQRLDEDDYIFRTESGKFKAIVREIKERNEKGQPVLVGTIAVSRSEALSDELRRNGIDHVVLNAKHHEQEAEIILDAGQKGAVTIATNMAGRGIDIKIPEDVKELGGLYVLGTERHESRRIDDQLRGRSGRQGDPGESRFFLSAQDDLVRVFAGDRMERVLGRFHKEAEDVPIFASILSNQIKGAQKRVEERNFVSRKNVLKYDDVLNTQRHQIYDDRREILRGASLRERILGWLEEEISSMVLVHCPTPYSDDWELDELWRLCATLWPVEVKRAELEARPSVQVEDVQEALVSDAIRHYDKREREVGEETMREVERVVFLQVLDTRWREHLDNMDYLRDGIGLRGLAQKNPLNEYRAEGYEMFHELQAAVKSEVVALMLRIEVEGSAALEPKAQRALDSGGSNARQPEVGEGFSGAGSDAGGASTSTGGLSMRPNRATANLTYGSAAAPTALQEAKAEAGLDSDEAPVVQQRRVEKAVGRNEPCPCGSGKKYKNCHGAAGG